MSSTTVTSISILSAVERPTTSLGFKSGRYDAVAHLDRWGGKLLLDWEFLCVRLHMSPGGVLSTPGPKDLYVSYPFGVCGVVVVSPSFRGVSCSVPRFPLLKKAFFRTQALGLPRLSGAWSNPVVGPTGGTSEEVQIRSRNRD